MPFLGNNLKSGHILYTCDSTMVSEQLSKAMSQNGLPQNKQKNTENIVLNSRPKLVKKIISYILYKRKIII
jgi:hypothetical protein